MIFFVYYDREAKGYVCAPCKTERPERSVVMDRLCLRPLREEERPFIKEEVFRCLHCSRLVFDVPVTTNHIFEHQVEYYHGPRPHEYWRIDYLLKAAATIETLR